MDHMPKTKVDVTKISGPYALLGLFLLITEALLGLWFFRAGEANERMIAGGLMTLIFLVFLYVVMRIATKAEQAASPAQVVRKRRWPTVVATMCVLAFIGLLADEFETGPGFGPASTPGVGANLQSLGYAPEPEDLSEDETRQRQDMLEERLRQLEEQSAELPQQAPQTAAASDLTGIWQGSDGFTYVFQQNGATVVFQQRNPLFQIMTATGGGTLQGESLSVEYIIADGTTGQGQMTIAPGGRQISGTFYNSLGQSGQLTLTLQQKGAGAEYFNLP